MAIPAIRKRIPINKKPEAESHSALQQTSCAQGQRYGNNYRDFHQGSPKLSPFYNRPNLIPGQGMHDKGLRTGCLGLLPRRDYPVRQGAGMNITATTRPPGGDKQGTDAADPADVINPIVTVHSQTCNFFTGLATRPPDRPQILIMCADTFGTIVKNHLDRSRMFYNLSGNR